jgi:hypothetical protein
MTALSSVAMQLHASVAFVALHFHSCEEEFGGCFKNVILASFYFILKLYKLLSGCMGGGTKVKMPNRNLILRGTDHCVVSLPVLIL